MSTCSVLLLILIVHVLNGAPARNRSSFPRKSWTADVGGGISMEMQPRPPGDARDLEWERRSVWGDLQHKGSLLNNSQTQLSQTLVRGRQKRGRRHALFGGRSHLHGQLMRVGCILGTCQVQKLSFRLYQLTGMRKKDHSPPISLKSPHSYG